KAKALHGGQGGFTLIELMVVLAILGIIVGLVVPNMFGVIGEAEATQIQGQHEKMREAAFQYYADTSEYPTEWSGHAVSGNEGEHQLSTNADNSGNTDPGVNGWAGPYLDRPILQENSWDGYWGIVEDIELESGEYYTVLAYQLIPLEICQEIDAAMDDGHQDSGVVQYDATDPQKNSDDRDHPSDWDAWYGQDFDTDDDNTLVIAIAKED
ncbi:MAG: type II secretion system protein, partial [Dehalococcoidia bacterium]